MPLINSGTGISDLAHNTLEQRLTAFICLGSTLCTAECYYFLTFNSTNTFYSRLGLCCKRVLSILILSCSGCKALVYFIQKIAESFTDALDQNSQTLL